MALVFNPFTGNFDFVGSGSGPGPTPQPFPYTRVTLAADETVSALKCVYANTPTTIKKASCNDIQMATVIGVSITGGTIGSPIDVVTFGPIDDASFTWPQGTQLYCDSIGNITDVCPSSVFRTKIGFSNGPGQIMISITEPIEL